jgi:hypothetical protein
LYFINQAAGASSSHVMIELVDDLPDASTSECPRGAGPTNLIALAGDFLT